MAGYQDGCELSIIRLEFDSLVKILSAFFFLRPGGATLLRSTLLYSKPKITKNTRGVI